MFRISGPFGVGTLRKFLGRFMAKEGWDILFGSFKKNVGRFSVGTIVLGLSKFYGKMFEF